MCFVRHTGVCCIVDGLLLVVPYSVQYTAFFQCLLGYRTRAIVRCYTLHVVRCTSTMVSGAWCSVCATVRMVRDMLVWYCVRYSLCSAVFCVLYGMVVSYNF